MASAKDQRVANRINAVEKLANKANQESQITRSDLENTHFDLLEKIRKMQEELNELKKLLAIRP